MQNIIFLISGRGYHFKSYLNKKLSISKATKSSSLLSQYWSDDFKESEIKIDGASLSEAFTERSKLISKSRDVHFIFSPLIDLLNTERYLPPHTQIKIELERGSMAMCLSSPDDNLTLKIQMLDINMTARRFLPISSIALQHEKRFLSGGGFILPFTRTSIRHRTLHSGILSTTIPAIFSGDLPYHFLVGIQSNEQLSLLSHNPYIFKPHGLKNIRFKKME